MHDSELQYDWAFNTYDVINFFFFTETAEGIKSTDALKNFSFANFKFNDNKNFKSFKFNDKGEQKPGDLPTSSSGTKSDEFIYP